MKKFLLFIFLFVLTLGFVGCGDEEEPLKQEEKNLVYADGTALNMAVVHNSTKTSISFKDSTITGSGLKLADGVTYQTDDLKPVWAELEKILKVDFTDKYSGETSAQKEYRHWQALDFVGVDVLVGNADDMAEDGKKNKIVNLTDWIDYMPNFKKFLEDNPIVKLSILSDTETGAMYYAPYFDGFDDIEKYYLMRTDWLEKLLDGEGDFTATTTDKFGDICKSVKYQPYMPTSGTLDILSLSDDGKSTTTITKNYSTSFGNIVDYMNKNVTAATTGVELVNMLRDYIDTAYNGLYGTKRSNLFQGYNACWDADELVALLRCVVTNTFALTNQNEKKVTGIFPRESSLNRTSDLFSLVSLFGTRGYESRNNYLYFNDEGVLCDARGEEGMASSIGKLNELYAEGLILQEFDTTTDKIYEVMYRQNLGFMIYDYLQTQTLYNDDAATLATCPDFNLTAVINPVAKWFDGTEGGVYMRFTESWRSVKTSGWCIPATTTGDKLKAALKMFDYMYSDEGNVLMSYGPSAWRSGKTIDYKGEQVPELSEAALKELKDLGKGNYTNYARNYLGSTLPIGFVKDQGMEYQCTTEGGKIGGSIVSTAIAKGVIKHVSPAIQENMYYTMVPTVLPTTAAQDVVLSGFSAINSSSGIFSRTKGNYNIFIDIIKSGFGSGVALNNKSIDKMPATAKEMVDKYFGELGGSTYIYMQREAWETLKVFYDTKINK